MKDSIDFGSMDVSMLFRKLLVPTVLGMVFSAIFVITDGIFVGKGIGSDALAAVNIAAPFFMIATGIGLMFGIGGSVVASIHLSQGKNKAASINITQALIFSSLIILVMSVLCCLFVEPLAQLLGSSEKLLPLVIEYMLWYLPFLIFYELLSTGMFFIRLDGSPNYAMMCNAVAAILNIILDYIFIFEFGWGMMGAAFATSLGTIAGGLMTLIYLLRFSHSIRLYRIKLSIKSLMLTFRNVGYMIKLGTSGFISEASIACMMFLGKLCFHPPSRRRRSSSIQHCLLFLPHHLYGLQCYCTIRTTDYQLQLRSRTTRSCQKSVASCLPDSFNLWNLFFHHHCAMQSEYRFIIYRPQLSRI